MIDPARLSRRCLLEPEIMVDDNPVDGHPGPRSHANFASRVVEALDLSAPRDVAARPIPQASRRVLVLGSSCPAKAGKDADCVESRCLCRQLNGRHGFLEGSVDSPLAENTSNDRIIRTLVVECSREKPEFVFASFSDRRSCEHFLGDRLVELSLTPSESPTPELAKLTDAYRQFTTNELCDLNALRNILMAQEFLEMQRVPYILSIPSAFRWRNMNLPDKHPVLRMYASLIIPTSLCNGRRQEGKLVGPHGDGESSRRGAIELTREFVDRLKRKIHKVAAEDPNVYPLW